MDNGELEVGAAGFDDADEKFEDFLGVGVDGLEMVSGEVNLHGFQIWNSRVIRRAGGSRGGRGRGRCR